MNVLPHIYNVLSIRWLSYTLLKNVVLCFQDGSRRPHHISRSGTAGGLPHTQPTGLPSSGTGSLADPGCLSRIWIFFFIPAELRIRIRINLSCWIRIRIQIANPDPDPGGQKWPKIEKSTEFLCFEVLDVLFWWLLLQLGRPLWTPKDK